MNESFEERIAIIMEGAKVSEAEAIRMMNQTKDYSDEVSRLRILAEIQQSKRRKK